MIFSGKSRFLSKGETFGDSKEYAGVIKKRNPAIIKKYFIPGVLSVQKLL